MITIRDFLKNNGIDISFVDSTVEIKDLVEYIKEYSIMVREEQIKFCAVGSAHYTSLNVRKVPERLDDDLRNHLNVCRVDVSIK